MKTKLLLFLFFCSGILFFPCKKAYSQLYPTNGLVLHYSLNNTSNDDSGNDKHLNEVSGITYQSSQFQGINALNFATSNSYARRVITNEQSVYQNTNFSISMWVNPNTTSNTYRNFFELGTNVYLRAISNGNIQFGYMYGTNTWRELLVNNVLTNNSWNHLTATVEYSGSNYTLRLYVNGTQAGSVNYTDAPTYAAMNSLQIGHRQGVTNMTTIGSFQDVFYYNRGLSASEVAQLYLYQPSIINVAQYNFNNTMADINGINTFATNSGTSFVTDRFGNANSALNINNTGSNAAIPNLPYGNTPRTISYWVKLNSFNSNGYNMTFQYGTASNGTGCGGSLAQNNVGFLGYNNNFFSTTTNSLNTWYYITHVYDGTTAKNYRNGQFMSEEAKIWNTGNNNNLFKLGTGVGGELWFNGALDDLMIFNTALSVTQIDSLFNLPDQQSLIARYNFNNTMADVNGANPFATNSGTSFVEDRLGNANSALNINNTGSNATIPNLPYGNTPRTISYWVKLNSFNSNGYNMTFQYGTASNGTGCGGSLSQNNVGFLGYNNNLFSTTTNSLNTWYYITHVYDGTTAKNYRNGQFMSEEAKIWNTGNNNNLFKLGTGVGGELWFNGALDDFMIFNKGLTNTQVDSLYNMAILANKLSVNKDAKTMFYPNPATEELNIVSENNIVKVTIYNMNGQEVKTSTETKINISTLPSGMYFVKVLDQNNQVITQKLIKE
jgi:hypothetical protein